MDRIVKFGDGQYRYDNRGLVVQNAREEKFHYNAKGLLVSKYFILGSVLPKQMVTKES